jgi:hypothetical protein
MMEKGKIMPQNNTQLFAIHRSSLCEIHDPFYEGRRRFMVFNATQQYFSCIEVVSFIGGGNLRKSLTCRKSLTNFIT